MERLDIEEPRQKRRKLERILRVEKNVKHTEEEEEEEEQGMTTGKTERIEVNTELHGRLRDFIPQIKRANEALDETEGTIEDIDENEEHVEMNLGLGVLEERGENASEEEEEEEGDNIFDRLLRRTKDPIRSVLIKTLNDDERTKNEEGEEENDDDDDVEVDDDEEDEEEDDEDD